MGTARFESSLAKCLLLGVLIAWQLALGSSWVNYCKLVTVESKGKADDISYLRIKINSVNVAECAFTRGISFYVVDAVTLSYVKC